VSAQERIPTSGATNGGAIEPSYGPGWTFTPTFGFAETYDDNISLFGLGTAEEQNNDYIATYFPAADVHYTGRHTRFGMDYTGSFLAYRTFTQLNRWDQRGGLDLRRDETSRLKWFAHGAAALVPSTDEIDLGGIPFRHTGARTLDGRAGIEYAIDARNTFTTTANYQVVDFDRPDQVAPFLRGGHMFETITGWRHHLDERLSVGADYSYRRAAVVGDLEQFDIHMGQAAVDYDVNALWTISAGGGAVFLLGTGTTEGHTGPAWRVAVQRHRGHRTFHISYERSYIPAFGFGGTIQNQQVGAGFKTPLFGSRYWYTDQAVVFRDDAPLTDTGLQLPLRSLRTYSIVGWEPQRYVRLEVYYARTQQTSLRAGGEMFRNRVGFQIVTSKPMRMQ
jgi:hypothetical protein